MSCIREEELKKKNNCGEYCRESVCVQDTPKILA
jgi:hypothetical protein